MAADARYSFPRGKDKETKQVNYVTGPSVYLAREAARHWGNLRTGQRIVSMDAEYVHVKGYCYDVQTNTYNESEDKFRAKIQRKDWETGQTVWKTPDERDLRELINKRAAICVRNAILTTLPSDVIEDAMAEAEATLRKVEEKNMQADPVATVRKMVDKFAEFGVTVEMLEQYVNHKLDICTPDEIAQFRTIHASMRDGQSKREDYFVVGEQPAQNGASGAQTLAERIKAQNAAKNGTAPAQAQQPPPPTEKQTTPEEAADLLRSMEAASEPAKPAKTTRAPRPATTSGTGDTTAP
jgi:hypothetical protein